MEFTGLEGSIDMTDRQPSYDREGSRTRSVPSLLTDLRRLFAPQGPRTMRCRLRYSIDDPYAVRIDLIAEVGVSVTWVVSRDLLYAGTKGPVGEGDFKAWPSRRHHSARPCLYFGLDRPEGHVAFEAGLPEVRRWLERTFEVVPAGCESDLLDWDALAESLLGRG
ncbi:SsgA family sporulation/cell division regulator [Streptomyces sp. NPDC059894]|uniref:SsgA family sporulation/cell division regulator n=1 Tax=unclassified Streptomyces TaxID=2593676 RepID=UPI00364D3185